ncbi:hypothetical protein [uncultured Tateyamaria sp.]|uniref:hypothetical protein n=1 Tax=uncultured Tateyamaria sp. TaxID=455651 RepID=UPI00260C2504|nr:hypothetical protein [uncultured Tateyamaria sp.]
MLPEEIEANIHDVCDSERIFSSYEGDKLEEINGWQVRSFLSPKPMMGEDDDGFLSGPYPYPFYVFVNKVSGNIIVASLRYTITNSIIENLNYFLSHRMNKTLQRLSFDIEAIRRSIERGEEEAIFATFVQLDVNDFSSKIETLSISGGDVLGVDFLNRFDVKSFRARQIGLRVSTSFSETCRLQGTGGMQFYSDRLRDLEISLGSVHRSDAIVTNY